MIKPKIIRSRELYGDKLIIKRQHLEIGGPEYSYTHESVIPGDGIAVLPFLDDNNILLSVQYRPAVKKYLLELIQGGIENQEFEEPIEAARRELLEETGYSGEMIPIQTIYPVPGFVDMRLYLFQARNIKKIKEPESNPFEKMKLIRMDYEKALNLTIKGKIKDSALVIALLNSKLS